MSMFLDEGGNIGTRLTEVKSGPSNSCSPRISRYRCGKVAFGAAQFGDVVAAGEESPDVARCLAQALAVLDEGDADETLAIFAETDPRRHRDIGPLEQ